MLIEETLVEDWKAVEWIVVVSSLCLWDGSLRSKGLEEQHSGEEGVSVIQAVSMELCSLSQCFESFSPDSVSSGIAFDILKNS